MVAKSRLCECIQEKPEQKAFRAFSQKRSILSVEASTCKCLNKERVLSPVVCPLFQGDVMSS